MSALSNFLILCCTIIHQTLANSNSVLTDAIKTPSTKTKSSDMPASVVILLLLMFIALGFIGIRHIKREYLQQQSYLFGKQAGTLFNNNNNITTNRKSYGSTFSPQLNAENIDEYIDDQLYDNNSLLIHRLNQYRLSLQQRFVDYMEKTPEPVLYEVSNDKTVGAYCKNPQIPHNPNYTPQKFKNSENYDPNTSPALQKMFHANYEKNQSKNDAYNKVDISVRHKFDNEDFNEYDDGGSDGSYEAIPENNVGVYSDSDRDVHDSDNGNVDNRKQNDKPVLTKKVVVLDLD